MTQAAGLTTVRSLLVGVLVITVAMASGCFRITSKGPKVAIGPGVMRNDWGHPRRDPDPTLPLMPTTENPWAAEAPRRADTEDTPRWRQRDVEDWLLRSTAALLVGAATGDLQLLDLWFVW